MAQSKKFAGLPDLDAAPEIYETPELTDDASTVQTGTFRTLSPSPSDEESHDPDAGLDRQRIDRDEARRRFEPARVDARDVDFSDNIGSSRKSYRTGHRRRRRRDNVREEYEELSDSEEESLPSKIARLRREAEEVRQELERREEGEFKEAVEEQNDELDAGGVTELSRILEGLHTSPRTDGDNGLEAEFAKRLASNRRQPPAQSQSSREGPTTTASESSPSTTAAIAAFSDRITALEAALGISSIPAADETTSILPTLASLTTQITTLTSTLAPSRASNANPTSSHPSASPLPTLDAIATRIRTLTAESDKLTLSRKAALQSLTDLHDARLRHSSTTTASYPHHGSRPTSQQQPASQADIEQAQLHAQLFLDEQSTKIAALYQILPTIQNLSPLLPVVLERLRSLSVIHAGAASARTAMDEVERRQGEAAQEISRWKAALEGVEEQMKEMEGVLKGNVEVVGELVKGVEERVGRLEGRGMS